MPPLMGHGSLPLQKEKVTPKRLTFGQRIAQKRTTPPTPTTAERNAAEWRRPGGGYDQWKQGDAQREKDLPIGGMAPIRRRPLPEYEEKEKEF